MASVTIVNENEPIHINKLRDSCYVEITRCERYKAAVGMICLVTNNFMVSLSESESYRWDKIRDISCIENFYVKVLRQGTEVKIVV